MVRYAVYKFYLWYFLPNVIIQGLPYEAYDIKHHMIRCSEGCIMEDKSNFFSPYRFAAATGTRDYHRKGMFEGHCCERSHLFHCFNTTVFISHMSLKVNTSVELQFIDATRWHFVKWL